MNVLYLHCHDAGRVLAPYGYAAPTPNISRLASDATLFRQAYSCAPTCSPSRAALLTGLPPHEAGMLGLVHRGFRLRDPRRHLACVLRESGFETALAGVQHELFPAELTVAYETVFPEGANHLDKVADLSVAQWAAGFLRRGHERPFFLSCGFFYPHREFPPAGRRVHLEDLPLPAFLPEHPAVRRDFAQYLGAVAVMDEAMGVVLDAVAAAGLHRDTLIVFTTDHGVAFPGAKCTLTDAGIGVALIVRAPDGSPSAPVTDALVSQLDVAPTVLDYAGIARAPWHRGASLRPTIEGRETTGRDAVFAEMNFHAAYEPARCVRTRRHKLIRYFDDDGLRPVANIDNSPTKKVWVEAGGAKALGPNVQLYDLQLDPGERCNLAERSESAAERAELEKRLLTWMRETDDPLLKGPIAPPRGTLVNSRTSVDAEAGPFEWIEA